MRYNSILLSALCGLSFPVFAQTPDTIYHGGPIVTVSDAQPSAEALAVKDGKILAVGKKSDVLKTKGDATKLVDLGGKALLPGFVDGHCHFNGLGDRRYVLIHGVPMRADQLDTCKELQPVPTLFSMHTFYWGDW